jgi:hypothetical protein
VPAVFQVLTGWEMLRAAVDRGGDMTAKRALAATGRAKRPKATKRNTYVRGAPGTETGSGTPLIHEHLERQTLIQEYWVPAHDERRESALFRKNKNFLRDQVGLPCWICRKGKADGEVLEVHHVFEWALWNAMTPERVTRILDALEFYEDGYVACAGDRKPELERALAEVAKAPVKRPDDIRNLVVLCQRHHRSRFTGVHMISFPIWIALAAVDPKQPLVREQVVAVANQLRRIDEAVADIVLPAKD